MLQEKPIQIKINNQEAFNLLAAAGWNMNPTYPAVLTVGQGYNVEENTKWLKQDIEKYCLQDQVQLCLRPESPKTSQNL